MGKNEENGEGLIVTDDLLIRYLLGQLQEAERLQIQQLSFIDDDLFDRLLEAENDLIDRYATGELTGPDRDLFEKTVLQRESTLDRLSFARALGTLTAAGKQVAAAAASGVAMPSPIRGSRRILWYTMAAAAALVVMIAGTVWVIRLAQEQPARVAQNRAADERAPEATPPIPAASDDSNQSAHQPPGGPGGPQAANRFLQRSEGDRHLVGTLATFVIRPGSTRSSDESQTLMIGLAVREVKLHLQVDEADEYQSYGAILRTARGNEVWKRSGLSASPMAFGKAVTIELAAPSLGPGQYEVELTGQPKTGPSSVINYYYFKVAKKD